MLRLLERGRVIPSTTNNNIVSHTPTPKVHKHITEKQRRENLRRIPSHLPIRKMDVIIRTLPLPWTRRLQTRGLEHGVFVDDGGGREVDVSLHEFVGVGFGYCGAVEGGAGVHGGLELVEGRLRSLRDDMTGFMGGVDLDSRIRGRQWIATLLYM